jgi:hypothetical protein
MSRVITITKGIQMGSTIGAFMYAYYIAFKDSGYAYSFQATEEGISYAAQAWKEGGYEIKWMKIEKGEKVSDQSKPDIPDRKDYRFKLTYGHNNHTMEYGFDDADNAPDAFKKLAMRVGLQPGDKVEFISERKLGQPVEEPKYVADSDTY